MIWYELEAGDRFTIRKKNGLSISNLGVIILLDRTPNYVSCRWAGSSKKFLIKMSDFKRMISDGVIPDKVEL